MEIIGIGTEIVECVRIARMIERHGEQFLHRAFTSREITFCQKQKRATDHFAGYWAAKEAVLKCLSQSRRRRVVFTDIEIRQDSAGRFLVHAAGSAKELLQKLCVAQLLLSIAHSRSYAIAYATALGGASKRNKGGAS